MKYVFMKRFENSTPVVKHLQGYLILIPNGMNQLILNYIIIMCKFPFHFEFNRMQLNYTM